jgi:hypothetical protein
MFYNQKALIRLGTIKIEVSFLFSIIKALEVRILNLILVYGTLSSCII